MSSKAARIVTYRKDQNVPAFRFERAGVESLQVNQGGDGGIVVVFVVVILVVVVVVVVMIMVLLLVEVAVFIMVLMVMMVFVLLLYFTC